MDGETVYNKRTNAFGLLTAKTLLELHDNYEVVTTGALTKFILVWLRIFLYNLQQAAGDSENMNSRLTYKL